MKLIAILLIDCFFSSPCFVRTQEPGSKNDHSKNQATLKRFFPLVINNSLNPGFFLDELNIQEYQQTELISHAAEARKKWLALVAKMTQHEINLKEDEESCKEFGLVEKEFNDQVRETLLPRQLTGLEKLLRQRQSLKKMGGKEPFLLPLFVLSELDLSPAQKKNDLISRRPSLKSFKTTPQSPTPCIPAA
tara:strand:+ start:2268 stop:2840 length:573 start_codon:yes stop_codon:yes gene_type:complete